MEVIQRNHPKESIVKLINIIKEEIEINEQLKKKIIWACSFNNTSPIIKNGSLLKLEPTNVTYVEPHRITINDKLYLLFNGCDYTFIGNLNNKIKLAELDSYIRNC